MRFGNFVQHIASNSPRCERKPRNECNSIPLAIIHDIVPFAICKAISVLDGDDGNNLARTLPIPGTSSVEHRDENVAAASVRLSDEEYERLAGVPELVAMR